MQQEVNVEDYHVVGVMEILQAVVKEILFLNRVQRDSLFSYTSKLPML